MEHWQDQGIVLSVRGHGESGAIVSLLTAQHGRHAGYVHGARSSRKQGLCEAGNLVEVDWNSRVSDNLGGYDLGLLQPIAARVMDDPLKLAALQSACGLCNETLPERDVHEGLFQGLLTLLEIIQNEDDAAIWGAAYVMWEIALLRELGFALDISRCAGGGDARELAYISPRTGCAVSWQAGEPYKDKLLPLPGFLKPNGGAGDIEDVKTGLRLTAYFLEHRALIHSRTGMPEGRVRLFQRLGP
ncbi:MAG: DNA repair protein RecO [Alphaproteobacteria bacterium]|nr:DNA repair protein RecO [Alphaproteobacteria bacterium]MCD8570831.1 DNA repair protein RecO [Alphaproteobacteria bacterium]